MVKEAKTLPGYTIDPGTQSQTVVVNSADTQTITFYNTPGTTLTIQKYVDGTTDPIQGVTFLITDSAGTPLGPNQGEYVTDRNGRIVLNGLTPGTTIIAKEVRAAEGYKLDNTPTYFTVEDGKPTSITITTSVFSGILLNKTDSVTGKGISGVTFLLYDSANKPIGQYTTDNTRYIYINDLTTSGKYFLKEMENKGYIVDTELKTVYVTASETTLVEWKNTPITGQIQVTKTSAEYNTMNGWPAGTPLPNTEFEIYEQRSGNLVDTIRSDSRGPAVSRPLPLERYTIQEVKAPANYGVNENEFEVTNKSMMTGVSITKTGPSKVMAGQPVRYNFSDIANSSNVRLDSFYWRDVLPAEVRLDTVVTGTYNFPGVYKITYRVNGGEPRTLADNLSTSKNYILAASAVALGLASNERVTEIMFVFGQAPAGFAQVEKPALLCTAVSRIAATSFVNVADVGGVYNGTWVQAISRWVTKVYSTPTQPKLPRTGY